MKIVIDTNVIISGVISSKGPPGKILYLLSDMESKIEILISEEIFEEYRVVLLRPKFSFPKETIINTLAFFNVNAIFIYPFRKLNVTLDPDDNKFLECAVTGQADFLITGNKKHYPFSEFEGTKIVTPAEFLSFL